MPTACINQPDARVHLRGERLEIRGREGAADKEQILREIPIRDLDRLIVIEGVSITGHALAELLRAQIPVNLLAWNGRYLGGFLPASQAHGRARLRQYQRTLDSGFALQIAVKVLQAKLYNQRRVLQRLIASRNAAAGSAVPPAVDAGPAAFDDTGARDAVTWLDGFFSSQQTAADLEELRGYEGAATARYFQTWASFLPPDFPFERRSTRPPLNPVNACISFGATLLYSELVAFIHAHGLDPALGVLHNTEDGRWSLALDLVEPFRPVLVEALALDLFGRAMLGREHFESREGGVFLNEAGRQKFFLQYERRLERQFMSEAAGHRTTLRQQLEQQVVMFKSALDQPATFEPFLMN
jgi:CRISPR-associated protein Cas1